MKPKHGFLCKLKKNDEFFMQIVVIADYREEAHALLSKTLKHVEGKITYTLDYINILA